MPINPRGRLHPAPALPRPSVGVACLLALSLAACATSPGDYAAALSPQDPKFATAECAEMRAAAAGFRAGQREPSWAQGLLLGPYGLGIVAAGKDHQEKQRQLFVREMHLRCSSAPLPKELQFDPARLRALPE